MKRIDGMLSAKGMKLAIVASRFNAFIVEKLVDGAMDAIVRTGGSLEGDAITLVHCPGSFEIPQVARRLVESGEHDGIICLGCVIRGATAHFDYVAGEASKGIGQLAHSSKIPVVFGVLTTDTIEQAIERAGTKAGNKGFDAAMAAIEMVSLFQQLESGSLGNRRKAREIALQVLYQLDGNEMTVEQALRLFWSNFAREESEPHETDDSTRDFAAQLVGGMREHQAEIDALIGKASRNWRLERMARVDRNLLRLAVYELKYCADVPAKVAINEAIEIAKRYGTAESPAFVNGILDRCLEEVGR